MKKKVLSLMLCVLLIALMALPANAAESAGNGYHTRDIVYNGKTYQASLATNYSATYGARMMASCQAYIRVWIKAYTVTFDTLHHGYITNTGSPRTTYFGKNNTTVYTSYLACSVGMSDVIKYKTISGSAVFYASSQYTLNATANNG